MHGDAAVGMDGFVKLYPRAERCNHQRHFKLHAGFNVVIQTVIGAVNDLVENEFIPNIENAEVKALFVEGLKIFKAHEHHAEMMVKSLK